MKHRAAPAAEKARALAQELELRIAAGEADMDGVRHDFDRRTLVEDLQRRDAVGVADEVVRQAKARDVEGAGERNADRLVAPAAEILEGRVEARRHDLERGAHAPRLSCGT